MKRLDVCAVAVLSVVLVGCGGGDDGGDDGGTGPGGSTSAAVDVRDNSFSPSTTTVPAGTTVTWTWRGGAQHDVVFTGGTRSPLQAAGTYSRQFPTAGEFAYQCSVHGASMSGRVIVQ